MAKLWQNFLADFDRSTRSLRRSDRTFPRPSRPTTRLASAAAGPGESNRRATTSESALEISSLRSRLNAQCAPMRCRWVSRLGLDLNLPRRVHLARGFGHQHRRKPSGVTPGSARTICGAVSARSGCMAIAGGAGLLLVQMAKAPGGRVCRAKRWAGALTSFVVRRRGLCHLGGRIRSLVRSRPRRSSRPARRPGRRAGTATLC
jgi:hypothetical protein